jgi:hypothetical protein
VPVPDVLGLEIGRAALRIARHAHLHSLGRRSNEVLNGVGLIAATVEHWTAVPEPAPAQA